MFKYLLILISMMFISVSFAQDWCWERNDELLNPSGIKTLGMNTPFTGDFDGDGDIDLIVGCKRGVVQYYENIGTPDSAIWQMDEDYFTSLELDTLLAPQPSLVDLDGDGVDELYLYPVNNVFWRFINSGTNENPIWEYSEFNIGYDLFGLNSPQFIDYENDGALDLVMVRDEIGQLVLFQNIGDPENPVYELNEFIFATCIPDTGSYNTCRLADICGDDKLEIILVVGGFDGDYSNIVYYVNNGSIENPYWVETGDLLESSYWTYTSFSDMDNDSDLDMLVGNHLVPLFFNENLGSQDSVFYEDIFNGQRFGPLYVFQGDNICFVDYDNDMDYDFTFFYHYYIFPYGNPEGYVGWGSLTNIGNPYLPSFSGSGFSPWIFSTYRENYLSEGDLNGDNFPEITINYSPPRYIINNNGQGYTWSPSILIEIDPPEFHQYPELADLNNDGLTDLLIRHESELTWKCFRNTGTPQEPAWTETPDWIAGIDSNIAVYRGANINNDNRIDLIGVDENWHLQGYINTGTEDEVSFAYNPEIFADWQDYPVRYYDCVDIDGDGDDDVLVDSAGVINLIENMTPLKITESDDILPWQFTLYQNYPNPFNASTTISFVLANKSEVDLAVYDITGRLVRNIHSGIISPGEHSFIWDGRNNHGKQLSSGVYFYKLQTGSNQDYKKMILLK